MHEEAYFARSKVYESLVREWESNIRLWFRATLLHRARLFHINGPCHSFLILVGDLQLKYGIGLENI